MEPVTGQPGAVVGTLRGVTLSLGDVVAWSSRSGGGVGWLVAVDPPLVLVRFPREPGRWWLEADRLLAPTDEQRQQLLEDQWAGD